MPIRTHCAERALRREHESLLLKWASAGLALQRVVVVVEGAQALSGFALAVWLLMAYLGRTGDTGGALFLVYWTLNLPLLGQEIALLARQYPAHRNVAARLLEPLRCPAQEVATLDGAAESKPGPVAIRFEEVGVRAAGRMILEGIDVVIERGSHIAVVGASGAGKSTFVGLLLGWYRPASGRIFVDGTRLDGAALRQLRRDTAWVDPVVHLWSRSLFDNLAYGAPPGVDPALGQVIHETGLYDLLRKLPRGLQTPLGDSGGLVSAGEGERVRFGRALLRAHARLVILDEPFRGLERQHRRELRPRAAGREVRGRYPMTDLAAAAWPRTRLADAFEALIRSAALARTMKPGPPGPCPTVEDDDEVDCWVQAAARSVDLEAEAVEIPVCDVEAFLRQAGPALFVLRENTYPGVLALVRGGRRWVHLVGPDARVRRVKREEVSDILRRTLEAPVMAEVDDLLERAGVAPTRRSATRTALLREQLASRSIAGCWLIRLPPGAHFGDQCRHAGVTQMLAVFAAAHVVHDLLWVLAWWLIGRAALEGRYDRGWLLAWALLLLTLVPLRMLATWAQGVLTVVTSSLLRRRLLTGALKMEPEIGR